VDPLTITFLTASTALIAGVASPIVSISVARRQFKASVISNNRERWIEALRDAISEYIAIVTTVVLMARHVRSADGDIDLADQEILKAIERIVLVRSKIMLMTNPTKDHHRDLCQCVEAVHQALVSKKRLDPEQWRSHLDAITRAGHTVLGIEWARVKRGD
jgi:uncharacterized membrane protein